MHMRVEKKYSYRGVTDHPCCLDVWSTLVCLYCTLEMAWLCCVVISCIFLHCVAIWMPWGRFPQWHREREHFWGFQRVWYFESCLLVVELPHNVRYRIHNKYKCLPQAFDRNKTIYGFVDFLETVFVLVRLLHVCS